MIIHVDLFPYKIKYSKVDTPPENVYFAVEDPDFDSRERFAKAVQIIETGRTFLFELILQKKTIDELKITIGALKWEGQLRIHVHNCLLKPGRNLTPNDFDTSLLYNILRRGQFLGDTNRPTKGWGKEPDPHAITIGDDIERIRILRNKLCHSPVAAMTQNEFESFTKEAKDIMHRWSNVARMDLVSAVQNLVSAVEDVVSSRLTVNQVNALQERLIEDAQCAVAQGTSKATRQKQTLVSTIFVISQYEHSYLDIY